MPGVLGAPALTKTRSMSGRHRINGAGLGEHGFFVLTRVVAVLIEMCDKTAVLIVLAPVQPERKQLGRQVLFTFIKTGGYEIRINSHHAILSISRPDNCHQQIH